MTLILGIAIGVGACLIGVLANFKRNESWFAAQAAKLDAILAKLPH